MKAFDEVYGYDGAPREALSVLTQWLADVSPEDLRARHEEAERLFRKIGITFAVYGEGGDPERLIPFDLIPRVLTAQEWSEMARGLEQRVKALNAFLTDVYNEAEIVKAGVVPAVCATENPGFLPAMKGFRPPGGVFTHIAGIDLVRTGPDDFYVLEDNCRTPSGVSYMLENRDVMMRLFPGLGARAQVAPVSTYTDDLLDTLISVAPEKCEDEPTVVVLTPGLYNSAYYEHCFLADEMGVELVQGSDLFVKDDRVFMETTRGPKRVDVIYRRIDDAFLDPDVFRKDSALGVKGLMSAYQKGFVTICNAPGAGVADDKNTYRYVPDMVRFYLGEEPILKNVPTYDCADPAQLSHVLENLADLVVKECAGSGGYGMLIGPRSTQQEQADFAQKLKAHPDAYIAQPTLNLSTAPTLTPDGVDARHLDLRPFVLVGADKVRLTPGGLTRVALKKGSLVVNSSQGGGTKDTWVLRDRSSKAGASC